MMRRSIPPQVPMPDALADHIDLALRRVAGGAEGAAELDPTAAGALSRLDVIGKLRIILADVEAVLVAWCIEDVQMSQPLLGDILDVDQSTVSRRAQKALPRLREILP